MPDACTITFEVSLDEFTEEQICGGNRLCRVLADKKIGAVLLAVKMVLVSMQILVQSAPVMRQP